MRRIKDGFVGEWVGVGRSVWEWVGVGGSGWELVGVSGSGWELVGVSGSVRDSYLYPLFLILSNCI